MSITVYRVRVETSGKEQCEYLLCGCKGSPIRFLSGTVAGAVARYFNETEATLIDYERYIEEVKQTDIKVRKREICLIMADEQRDENRIVFEAQEIGRTDVKIIGYLALSPKLFAMSAALHDTPARALGIPEHEWQHIP